MSELAISRWFVQCRFVGTEYAKVTARLNKWAETDSKFIDLRDAIDTAVEKAVIAGTLKAYKSIGGPVAPPGVEAYAQGFIDLQSFCNWAPAVVTDCPKDAHFLAVELGLPMDTEAGTTRASVEAAIKSAQQHRERKTPAPLHIGLPDTRLTKWLRRETWTPDEAALLVCGFDPDTETRTPQGNRWMKGLCGMAFAGDATFDQAEKLAKDWRRRVDTCERVRPADFVAWCKTQNVNTDWLRDVPSAPAPEDAAPQVEEIDVLLLASRQELIAAFGTFTGMDASWFSSLKDVPRLEEARKIVGQGGRGHIAEPLFCPFEVMLWMADSKRKKGRPLSETKAWEILEKNFPRIYSARSIGDPRHD